jgi:CheY-like chemotaxis protein
MLLPLGFKVAEATNGQECVEKVFKLKPDLVLLDLRMPVLDGFGATQQIRREETLRDLVIIAVSASVFEETRQRALKAGFNDFLIKPFQLENLLELLRTHLNIEWMYEDAEKAIRSDTRFEQEHVQFASLPPEEAENIRNFAKLGIPKYILSELDNIERQDTKYASFVNTLRQLAKNYQFDRIIELLETKEQEE